MTGKRIKLYDITLVGKRNARYFVDDNQAVNGDEYRTVRADGATKAWYARAYGVSLNEPTYVRISLGGGYRYIPVHQITEISAITHTVEER